MPRENTRRRPGATRYGRPAWQVAEERGAERMRAPVTMAQWQDRQRECRTGIIARLFGRHEVNALGEG
jgi:hypothetical protein